MLKRIICQSWRTNWNLKPSQPFDIIKDDINRYEKSTLQVGFFGKISVLYHPPMSMSKPHNWPCLSSIMTPESPCFSKIMRVRFRKQMSTTEYISRSILESIQIALAKPQVSLVVHPFFEYCRRRSWGRKRGRRKCFLTMNRRPMGSHSASWGYPSTSGNCAGFLDAPLTRDKISQGPAYLICNIPSTSGFNVHQCPI